MCKNLLFQTAIIFKKKTIFDPMLIDIFYNISFKHLFDYADPKRYEDLPKQT